MEYRTKYKFVQIYARDGTLFVKEETILKIPKLKRLYEECNKECVVTDDKICDLNQIIDVIVYNEQFSTSNFAPHHMKMIEMFEFTENDILNLNLDATMFVYFWNKYNCTNNECKQTEIQSLSQNRGNNIRNQTQTITKPIHESNTSENFTKLHLLNYTMQINKIDYKKVMQQSNKSKKDCRNNEILPDFSIVTGDETESDALQELPLNMSKIYLDKYIMHLCSSTQNFNERYWPQLSQCANALKLLLKKVDKIDEAKS